MTKLVKAAGSEAFRVITQAENLQDGLQEAEDAVRALAGYDGVEAAEMFIATEVTVVLVKKK